MFPRFNQNIKFSVDLPKKESSCVPTPCGPNSDCQERGDSFACTCLPGYIGVPPNCRPECTINPECPPHQACMQQKCRDPCRGICGVNAQCTVVNHHASCSCLDSYSGDPFSQCSPIINTGEYAAWTATKYYFPACSIVDF